MTPLGEYLIQKSVKKADVSRKTGISTSRLTELTRNEKTKLKAEEAYLIALAIDVEPGEILEKVFANQLSTSTFNFLKILVDKSRVAAFPQIADEFKNLLNAARNIKEVTAITASPLSEDLKAALIEKLQAITGSEIVLNHLVDSSLIGGILIKIGNEQIDGSVKSRLEGLKQDISAIIA